MKKGIVALLFLALMIAGPASADDHDDRWYITPAIGATWNDSDRGIADRENYRALSIGRLFTPNFSLDLRYDQYKGPFLPDRLPETATSTDWKLESLGLVGRFHFRDPQHDLRPYILVGGGIQEHRNFFDNSRDIYGAAGLGAHLRVTDRVALRAEAEFRHDNDRETVDRSQGYNDYIVSVGLNIRLGSLPPPPPEPAPEPAPPPPPPPPAPEPEPEPEPEVLFEFDSSVTFEFDSARLRPDAVAELNEAVALLNLHEDITRIEVAGHTCDLGPADYNQGLSERRARSVYDYLVDNGIDSDRLVVRGYGEERPRVPNTSDSNRQQNRRVELVVLRRAN